MKEFTFAQRDEFSRQPIAEKVISLLSSEVVVSPMVIDGGWGTGKTEFCHKLINLMNEAETHHLIYVDAFQADHADEPLLTVLAEVIKVLPTEEDQKGFMKKALPVVKYGMKALGKAGVAHLLRQDGSYLAENFDKEIQKAADTAIDATVESTLKAHVEADKNLKALQATLKEIADTKPIVLFIDELDRCRPDFAINMLEIIKHTFDVKGVQFVLVTNTQQLKAAINHCYGHSVNAQRYLDKFLKFIFTLPNYIPVQSTENTLASIAHYKKLIQNSQTLENTDLWENSDFNLVCHFIKIHNLTLREIETLVRYIEIYHELSGRNALSKQIIFGYRLLRLLGVLLFTNNRKLAEQIDINQADALQIAQALGVGGLVEMKPENGNPAYHQVLLVMIGTECFFNSEQFKPEEGYQESEWARIISEYFGGVGQPSEGQYLKIVAQAIKSLNLTS